MNLDATTFIALGLVVAFFAFTFVWVTFVQKRLRIWIRESLANHWKVTINERIRYRNISWEISGPHTRTQHILANAVLMITDFGCLVGPIFGALLLMGLLMFALSGD